MDNKTVYTNIQKQLLTERRIFNSPDGRFLLSMWKEVFAKSCVDNDPHKTYYNLGRLEFIQQLERVADSKDENIDEIMNVGGLYND